LIGDVAGVPGEPDLLVADGGWHDLAHDGVNLEYLPQPAGREELAEKNDHWIVRTFLVTETGGCEDLRQHRR
jgi:hypothetical protein